MPAPHHHAPRVQALDNLRKVYADIYRHGEVTYGKGLSIGAATSEGSTRPWFPNGSGVEIGKVSIGLGVGHNAHNLFVRKGRRDSRSDGAWIALSLTPTSDPVSIVLVDKTAVGRDAIRRVWTPHQFTQYTVYEDIVRQGSVVYPFGRKITGLTHLPTGSAGSLFLDFSGEIMSKIRGQRRGLGFGKGARDVFIKEGHYDRAAQGGWLGLSLAEQGEVVSYALVTAKHDGAGPIAEVWIVPRWSDAQRNQAQAYFDADTQGSAYYDPGLRITGVVTKSSAGTLNTFLNAECIEAGYAHAGLGAGHDIDDLFIRESHRDGLSDGIWLGLSLTPRGEVRSYACVDRTARGVSPIKQVWQVPEWSDAQLNQIKAYDDAATMGSVRYARGLKITGVLYRGSTLHSFLNANCEAIGSSVGIGLGEDGADAYILETHLAENVGANGSRVQAKAPVWLGLSRQPIGESECYVLVDRYETGSDAILRVLSYGQYNQLRSYNDADLHGSVVYESGLRATSVVQCTTGSTQGGYLNAGGIEHSQAGLGLGIGGIEDHVYITESHRDWESNGIWTGYSLVSQGPANVFVLNDRHATDASAIRCVVPRYAFTLLRIYGEAAEQGRCRYDPPRDITGGATARGTATKFFLGTGRRPVSRGSISTGLKGYTDKLEVVGAKAVAGGRVLLRVTGYNPSDKTKTVVLRVGASGIEANGQQEPRSKIGPLAGQVLDNYIGSLLSSCGGSVMASPLYGLVGLTGENVRPNFVTNELLVRATFRPKLNDIQAKMLQYDRLKRLGITGAKKIIHVVATNKDLGGLRASLARFQEKGLCQGTHVQSLPEFLEFLGIRNMSEAIAEVENIRAAMKREDEAWLRTRRYTSQPDRATRQFGAHAFTGDRKQWLQSLPETRIVELLDQVHTIHHQCVETPYQLELAWTCSYLFDTRSEPVRERVLLLYPELERLPVGAWRRIRFNGVLDGRPERFVLADYLDQLVS